MKLKMCSIVKIYQDELQANQCKTFSYTVKGYEKAEGIFIYGVAEVTLVFNKDSRVFINTLNLNTGIGSEPNKRALLIDHPLEGEFITGNIKKLETAGKVSIYLLMK